MLINSFKQAQTFSFPLPKSNPSFVPHHWLLPIHFCYTSLYFLVWFCLKISYLWCFSPSPHISPPFPVPGELPISTCLPCINSSSPLSDTLNLGKPLALLYLCPATIAPAPAPVLASAPAPAPAPALPQSFHGDSHPRLELNPPPDTHIPLSLALPSLAQCFPKLSIPGGWGGNSFM